MLRSRVARLPWFTPGSCGLVRAPDGATGPTPEMKDLSPLHEFVSARVVYQNAYFAVRAEGDCVLIERTDRAFENPSVLLLEFQAMLKSIAQVDRTRSRLIVDVRRPSGISSEEMEIAMRDARMQMMTGFKKLAVLVRSPVGRLHVKRHLREDALTDPRRTKAADAFDSEIEADLFMRGRT